MRGQVRAGAVGLTVSAMRELATTVGFMDASIADYLRHVHRDYLRHYFASTDLANNDEKNH
jgi:hypothetical protein